MSWFWNRELPSGGDGGFYLYTSKEASYRRFFVYQEMTFGYYDSNFILGYIFSLLSNFPVLIRFYIFYLALPSFCFLGSYFMFKNLTIFLFGNDYEVRNRHLIFLSSIISSLYFLLNPIATAYRWNSLTTNMINYALFNFNLFLILNYVNKNTRIKLILYPIIFSFLCIGFSSPPFFSLLILITIFLIALKIIIYKKIDFIQNFFVLTIIIFLINIWWMIPYFTQGNTLKERSDIDNLRNFLYFKDKPVSIYPMLIYSHKLWDGINFYNNFYMKPLTLILNIIIISIIFIPFFIINNKKKEFFVFLFFGFLLLLSLALSFLPNGPLATIFTELMKKFWILNIFRTSYDKFNILLVFSFSSMLFFSILILFRNLNQKLIAIFFLIIISSLLYIGSPFLTGGIFEKKFNSGNTLRNSPPEILSQENYLGKINQNFDRDWVLWVPTINGLWINTEWGYTGIDYVKYIFNGKHISSELRMNNYTRSIQNELRSNDFNIENFLNLTTIGNINTIVLRKDISIEKQRNYGWNDNEIFNEIFNLKTLEKNGLLKVIYEDSFVKIFKLNLKTDTNQIKKFEKKFKNYYQTFNISDDFNDQKITIEILMRKTKANDDPGWNVILSKKQVFDFGFPGGNGIHFGLFRNNSWDSITVGVDLDENWHQVVGIYDQDKLLIYYDCQLVGKKNIGNGLLNTNDEELFVGWNYYNFEDEDFEGEISFLNIYNYTLDQKIICNNFKNVSHESNFSFNIDYEKKIIFKNISHENIFEYQKINPTLYKVQVNSTEPFMLSFAESYDPLWVAKVKQPNGKWKEYQPVPLYSVINGFWIEDTGNLDIIIEYKPQRWFYYGLAISLTTLTAYISCLIYGWKRDFFKRICWKVIDAIKDRRKFKYSYKG